jgi:hypothetical protein
LPRALPAAVFLHRDGRGWTGSKLKCLLGMVRAGYYILPRYFVPAPTHTCWSAGPAWLPTAVRLRKYLSQHLGCERRCVNCSRIILFILHYFRGSVVPANPSRNLLGLLLGCWTDMCVAKPTTRKPLGRYIGTRCLYRCDTYVTGSVRPIRPNTWHEPS